ncbi:MAG: SCO family protein [Planctomycetota bacterium]
MNTETEKRGVTEIPVAESAASSATTSLLWMLLITVMGVVFLVWAFSRTGASNLPDNVAVHKELPRIKRAPAFSMINQLGEPVSLETFKGKPWIADFIFTDCPGPCPIMSQRMLTLQRALQSRGMPFHLVSFSLDPLRDRPHVLRKYAERFKADTGVWSFITCDDEEAMWSLAMDGFLQSVGPGDEEHRVIHSTYFVLIGPGGDIRAVYNGLDEDVSVSDLVARIVDDVASTTVNTDGRGSGTNAAP